VRLEGLSKEELKKVYEAYLRVIEEYFNDRKSLKYRFFYRGAITALEAVQE